MKDAKECKHLLADLKRKLENTKQMLCHARRFG